VARLERGVFAEIGADPRATRQGCDRANRFRCLRLPRPTHRSSARHALFVRAVAETQSVRTQVAIVAVATPVLLYAAFFAYVALLLD